MFIKELADHCDHSYLRFCPADCVCCCGARDAYLNFQRDDPHGFKKFKEKQDSL